MLNIPQFQKAAKDFRAGKLDIVQFTRLVYASTESDGSGSGTAADLGGNSGKSKQSPPAGSGVLASGSEAKFKLEGEPTVTANSATDALNHETARLDLDLDRAKRCGYSEVIYGPGKTAEDLKTACHRLLSERQNVLITRIEAVEAAELLRLFPSAIYNPLARTLRIEAKAQSFTDQQASRRVAVVTAGTGDIPIAEEAAETLRWMGWTPTSIYDVGVAGPHRLMRHIGFLQSCSAIVVVAGMEGALPSVVGGHVACPVIAVPTSLGYGAHFQGLVPLLAMLNSCASNVVAVNVDAGFKGGFLAGLILASK